MLLVVDDEMDLCEILRFNFEAEGFEVDTACSAEEALDKLRQPMAHYDLMLLDVMMDKMSGYDLAQLLRSEGNNIPIIFLTALGGESDQLHGFDLGADDYIAKPFSFQAVLARVKAVLKRSAVPPASTASSILTVGPLTIHTDSNKVQVSGMEVQLTRKEYDILLLLARNAGHYLTREDMLHQVWSDDICVNDRSVDVHIARLRKKIGSAGSLITNKTGFGYILNQ